MTANETEYLEGAAEHAGSLNVVLNYTFNSGLNTDGRTDELTNERSLTGTFFPPPSSTNRQLSNAREESR